MKAPGPDRTQNWVWTMAWEVLGAQITHLFQGITTLGYIPPRWKLTKTVMLAKPGKEAYNQPGAYRPISLLNTLAKIYEKTLTTYMSHLAECKGVLHQGHYGARPNRSSQEALIHLTSWVKAQWRAGRVVGAIFADVKSAFPSVHHPRMVHILETQGYPPELINIIQSFLTGRETYLSFNGFESPRFSLAHGLPQGSPLSPLLYLLYNNSLLALTDTHSTSEILGFVDDVVLMTAAVNQPELGSKIQKIADKQLDWARRHGAIFDVKKSKWMVFTLGEVAPDLHIRFGERHHLKPVLETKWLGVVIDNQLNFKWHRSEVIAKGTKRANFLSSLSNTKWGIPPRLFKILMTSTVHAATDYAVAAWLSLPIPKYFTEKLTTIDNICATKALGALRNSPATFLRHDLNLLTPDVRLSSKIVNTVAIIAAKPPTTPCIISTVMHSNQNRTPTGAHSIASSSHP